MCGSGRFLAHTLFYPTPLIYTVGPLILGTRGTGLLCVASLHHFHTEISAAGCRRRRQNAHPLPLADMPNGMFDQWSCLLVQQVQVRFSPTLLTSLSHPQSVSRTPLLHRHINALFDAQFHAPRATRSPGDTPLYVRISIFTPPTKRDRNNLLLFELCAEVVTYPSESGERENVQNTTSSSPTCQTRPRAGRL